MPSIKLPAKYQIYKTKEDLYFIRNSNAFALLEKLIPVEVLFIDHLFNSNHLDSYTIMSRCHNDSLQRAIHEEAALIILAPDFLIANGTINKIEEKLLEGYQLISLPSLRLSLEMLQPILLDMRIENGKILHLNSRDLVNLSLNYLHPISQHSIYGSQNTANYLTPHILLWPIQNSGYVGRFFYTHPVAIRPNNMHLNMNLTIDIAPFKICPDPKKDYLFTNSDDALIFEVTSLDRDCQGYPSNNSQYVIDFAKNLPEYHIMSAQQEVLLHTGNTDSHAWAKAKKDSSQLFSKVLNSRKKIVELEPV